MGLLFQLLVILPDLRSPLLCVLFGGSLRMKDDLCFDMIRSNELFYHASGLDWNAILFV